MKKYFIITLSFILLFSCKQNKTNSKKNNIVNIAALLSLTGNGAEYGKDEQNAITLFIKNQTEKNYKNKYNFIIEDTKSQPKDAVSGYYKISGNNKIDIVMTVLSSVSLAILPLTQKDSIPTFCVGANPDITDKFSNSFRSLPTSEYQTSVLSQNILKNNNIKDLSIIYLNDDFGVSLKNNLINKIENRINTKSFAIAQNDNNNIKSVVAKALSKKNDAIFIASYGNSIAYILKELKRQNYSGIIYSTLEVSYPKVLNIAKESAEGVLFVDMEIVNNKFIEEYFQTFNKKPSTDAVLAYDEISVFVYAYENNVNIYSLKGSDKEFKSACGKFRINPSGNFEYTLFMKQIRNGKPTIIK